MKTVLLTGFEPFNRETINPAWEAVRALDGWSGADFVVHARQLPCVFGAAIETIVAAGPAAYFSTLPIKAIVQALRAGGLPASVSQTAGTFVCNHVFYGLMHHVSKRAPMRAGFIHIPYLPQQAAAHPGAASMALADMIEGLRIAVRTALSVEADVRAVGGSTH